MVKLTDKVLNHIDRHQEKKVAKENALFDYWEKAGVTKKIKNQAMLADVLEIFVDILIAYIYLQISIKALPFIFTVLANFTLDGKIKIMIVYELIGFIINFLVRCIRYMDFSSIMHSLFECLLYGLPISFLAFSISYLFTIGSLLPWIFLLSITALLIIENIQNKINYNIAIAEGKISRCITTSSLGTEAADLNKIYEDISNV